jgi:superfamily I DNA/RNA helicase
VILTRLIVAAALVAFTGALELRADLSKARAEQNLEKRARLALDNAASQLRAASNAYKSGDWPKTTAALDEVRESVDLAYTSLKQTGKNPRNSRHFKNLEIKSRNILKTLGDFLRRMAFEEREQLQPLVDHIQQVHDEVLESIMSPPKRKRR